MKKALLLSALAVAATMTAGAKTAEELRVYINPGHGSWTANDRPNPVVGHGAYSRTGTDTLNFFESNTNLRKGFGVLERLIEYGLKFDRTKNQEGERWEIGAARDMENNIVMSHVKCGPYHDDNGTKNQLLDAAPADLEYYNRSLTEICAEVDANNFDMFISIHSNAASEGSTSNYPLYLYRGYDTPVDSVGVTLELQTASRKMADCCWGYSFANPHMVWTYYSATNKNLRGDINFYGSYSTVNGAKGYLGVLKHHVPGFLVEGYFHTYQPARHRAMNWDVDYVEGYAYARGIADYFELKKENFGTIYGIVRDQHEKFTDQYYKPNSSSDDIYKPLNGCTVTLKKDGTTVATYTTDNYYNGAFVFDGVEPGTYTVVAEHPDYKAMEPVEVIVEAAKDAYPSLRLEATDWVAPKEVYENYPDPAAKIATVRAADEYTFAAEYTDEAIEGLDGKIVRRAIAHKGKLYILAIDKLPTYAQVVADDEKPVPTIIVYDTANKKVLANVSTEGAYGSIQNVADIQVTSDGYLIASCQTKNQYNDANIQNLPDGTPEPRGTIYIYKWANDENGLPTGTPEQWLSTQQTGRWYRSYGGGTISYSGTSEDGKLLVSQPTITAPAHTLRASLITVTNGADAGTADFLTPNSYDQFKSGSNPGFGENYRIFTSPLDDSKVIYAGPDCSAVWDYNMNDYTTADVVGNDVLANAPGAIGAFKYAGASYLAVPDVQEGNAVGVKLINISKNINNAVQIPTTNTTVALPAEQDDAVTHSYATTGEVGSVYDEVNEVYTSVWINLYLVRDGKITKLTTKGVEQPVYKTAFAYGLTQEKVENAYQIKYALSADAVSADLVLTPTTGDVVTIPVEATKGAHTATVELSQLANDTDYAWEIKVASKSNATSGMVFSATAPGTVRGSIVTFTDPEYEAYGYTVVGHNVQYGFDVYNPEGELVATGMHKDHALLGNSDNQSNPLRGAEHMGHALVAAWGDQAYGVTAFNPLNADEDLYSVFEGEKASSGLISYNGVGIGGGTPCVAIQGKGENARMFTFDEDLLSNQIAVYNIGTSRTITTPPTAWGLKGLANTNVEMQAVENGIFASQVRNDFFDATPAVEFLSNEGTVLWKVNDKTDWPADMIKDCNSGLAVNKDGTLLAVSGNSGIYVFELSFDDSNIPVLKALASIAVTSSAWSTMRFDVANNLHFYGRGTGYKVFAITADKPVVSTAGKGSIGVTSGVSDIAVDNEENATPVYYNLNGIQVPADNLAPGVYVKVAGKTATKVIIK